MVQQHQSGSGGGRIPENLDTATTGASLGTVVAALANNLSDDYWYKSWLLILAPAFAVGVSTFAAWVKRWYIKRNHRKELDQGLQLAEEYLSGIVRSKRSTPEEKRYASEKLALLKRQRMDQVIDRVAFLMAREREEDS